MFVVHISKSTNEGHYIAYSSYNGIWNEYNDNEVTTNADINEIKNKAYYYCYRRVIENNAAYVKQLTQENVIENKTK